MKYEILMAAIIAAKEALTGYTMSVKESIAKKSEENLLQIAQYIHTFLKGTGFMPIHFSYCNILLDSDSPWKAYGEEFNADLQVICKGTLLRVYFNKDRFIIIGNTSPEALYLLCEQWKGFKQCLNEEVEKQLAEQVSDIEKAAEHYAHMQEVINNFQI